MICPCDVAVVLLAAGLSRRFGPADKLMAPLAGKPLIQHSIDLLDGFAFGERIAVVREGAPDLTARLSHAGYRLVVNPAPARGRGSSLALGVEAIERAHACLVWLADMPAVPAAHVQALLDQDGQIVASEYRGIRLPPALFANDQFAALRASSGDTGARAQLRDAVGVPADPTSLFDIDHVADLKR